ncbi:superoxide dismutase family protein [Subsaximicrobium wynnwilliamsii]|uniref:Superoxide dismutase [Cu-Zn] n=1 Tax=Subsaximicrobium wynnwilliamsii TaxID=291179 RepID=A0A5C6ZFW1_9FLAO|nr:superoxide dismutase family protein [Subsaximicrobium wynnwilliamsii]TXD83042.1 superoxide dismutase family protein [Subsaximicrobium wynnwilliamsii]TXD88786.1 superoxide dismutase family protein [Subsaximicrobium wynnwilliamsii]TXE02859.1 superoxide dismutase family protein [Subsaximicrobium wynnwilliamsii]
MKHLKLYAAALTLTLVFACKTDKEKNEMDDASTTTETDMEDGMMDDDANAMKDIRFALVPKSNSKVTGEVVFTEDEGHVTMTATLQGLSEGSHAIHIHENADCSAEDGSSAGGHWNPTAQPHGKWGDAAGYHKGDIGNFIADADGNAKVIKTTNEWCLGCDDKNKDVLSKSIIVHEGQDDFVSQPSGDAGGRVSCGGIIQ